jgi:hypothetical protein
MPPPATFEELQQDVLLIVCTVLNPFVDIPLLQSAAGALTPVSNALNIEIDQSMQALAADDKKNGTHNISFIVNTILLKIQEIGMTTDLGAGQLLEDVTTIGDLVGQLADAATPI